LTDHWPRAHTLNMDSLVRDVHPPICAVVGGLVSG
jgi:pimeloyl-ACP methyl ester carboxylesterase